MFFFTKKNKNFKLTIHQIPIEKFNKPFIKKYKNVLFVYDKSSNIRDDKFKSKSNVYRIDLSKIKHDGNINKNKKRINKIIKEMINKARNKKLKKIGLSTSQIGYQIKSIAPRTYDYLKIKLRNLEEKLNAQKRKTYSKKAKYNNSNNSNNNNNNSNSNDKKSKKKDKKEKPRDLIFGTDSKKKDLVFGNNSNNNKHHKSSSKSKKNHKSNVNELLNNAENYCEQCNKGKYLLKQELYKRKSPESQKYIENLTKVIQKCQKCSKKCSKISKKIRKMTKDKDIARARLPVLCKEDPSGKSKAQRIEKLTRTKLLNQYENINRNNSN